MGNIKMEKIVLASASPRRRELLSSIGLEFDVVESNFDESSVKRDCGPCNLARVLALEKAKDVYDRLDYGVVIGADTIVVIEGEILGKPIDEADARRMLELLSGTEHHVYTGVCIKHNNRNIAFAEDTKVRFFDLSDKEISDYIDTGEPFDKAGAYGIQGIGALIVSGITGDYYNVMGLPVGRLARELQNMY